MRVCLVFTDATRACPDEVLVPARDYRNRHASILLAPEALAEAMATAGA